MGKEEGIELDAFLVVKWCFFLVTMADGTAEAPKGTGVHRDWDYI